MINVSTVTSGSIQPQEPIKGDVAVKTGSTFVASTIENENNKQLVLKHQDTIVSATRLARTLSEIFSNTTAELSKLSIEFDDDTSEQAKYEHLLSLVEQLNVYFKNSCTFRTNLKERWEQQSLNTLLQTLDEKLINTVSDALKQCNIYNAVPRAISAKTPVLVPGATVPTMYARLQNAVQNMTDSPEMLMCLSGQRPLKEAIDTLSDLEKNETIQRSMDQYVQQYVAQLGHQKTEAHAFMALLDEIRSSDKKSTLNQHPVYVCVTGDVTYRQSVLNENGIYELGEISTGRANSEATFKSALSCLKKLYTATSVPNIISLISNQPHITTQGLALERVISLPEVDVPITVHTHGAEATDRAKKNLIVSIDTIRKSMELLNPSYPVTNNWTKTPECKLFKSEAPRQWECIKTEDSLASAIFSV